MLDLRLRVRKMRKELARRLKDGPVRLGGWEPRQCGVLEAK